MSQHTLWRLPQVEAETGYKRSSIYRLMKAGQFPRHVKIGERASVWVEGEVRAWIAGRIERSRRVAASSEAGRLSPERPA